MPRKNALAVFQSIIDGDMSTVEIISTATNIQFMDNIGIQLDWTGTPTGDFDVQISADHLETPSGTVITEGTWITIPLSVFITAGGGADSSYIDINQISAPWIRVLYTRTSGTGVVNCFIVGKEV